MNARTEQRLAAAEQQLAAATGRPVVITLQPGESQQAAIERAGAQGKTVVFIERRREPYADVA